MPALIRERLRCISNCQAQEWKIEWRKFIKPQISASGQSIVARSLKHQAAALITRLQAACTTHHRAKTHPPRRGIKHAVVSHYVWCKISGMPSAKTQPVVLGSLIDKKEKWFREVEVESKPSALHTKSWNAWENSTHNFAPRAPDFETESVSDGRFRRKILSTFRCRIFKKLGRLASMRGGGISAFVASIRARC